MFDAKRRYWRGKPAIAHLTSRIIPIADTLFNALLTLEVDVEVDSITETQIARLGLLTGYDTQKRLVANYRHIRHVQHGQTACLNDVRVRRAIAEAVNWDGRRQRHRFSPATTNARPATSCAGCRGPRRTFRAIPTPISPPRRSKLLTAAGWIPGAGGIRRRNGVPLAIDVSTTPSKPANVQAEVVMQQELRAAGIDLRVRNYPTSLLFAQDGPLYGGRYDLSLTIDTNAPDPDNEWRMERRVHSAPHGANTTFLNDPVITATSLCRGANVRPRENARRSTSKKKRGFTKSFPAVFLYWQIGLRRL